MTITRESETLSHFKRDAERVVQLLKRSGKPDEGLSPLDEAAMKQLRTN